MFVYLPLSVYLSISSLCLSGMYQYRRQALPRVCVCVRARVNSSPHPLWKADSSCAWDLQWNLVSKGVCVCVCVHHHFILSVF